MRREGSRLMAPGRGSSRRNAVRCEDVAPVIFDLAERSEPVPDELAGHVGQCLRCQAELAQHRKIARAMTQVRSARVDPPSDLVLGVLATIAAAGDQRDLWSAVVRHRAAYVAAATAATAAGAAAGAVLLSRSRRVRLSAVG